MSGGGDSSELERALVLADGGEGVPVRITALGDDRVELVLLG